MKQLLLMVAVVGCGGADPADKIIPTNVGKTEVYVRVGDKDWFQSGGRWAYRTGRTYTITTYVDVRQQIADEVLGREPRKYRDRQVQELGYATTMDAIETVEAYLGVSK